MDQGMCCRNSKFLVGFLLTVFMMVLTANGGEEECLGMAGRERIKCYECTGDSDDHYCSDPFNDTHPDVHLRTCKEYCAKWTRTTLSGKKYTQRSCSEQLHITLRKATVCIHESRPSSGQLCFCDNTQCNGAPVIRANYTNVILALILATINLYKHGLFLRVEPWR